MGRRNRFIRLWLLGYGSGLSASLSKPACHHHHLLRKQATWQPPFWTFRFYRSIKIPMPKANRTPLEVFYGFKILPILTAENTRHYLYMRKHENKSAMEGPLASDRTLFLVNLPVDATMEHLRHLFQAEGGIEKIYYHNASQPTLAYNEEEEDSEQEDNMDDTDQVQRSKRRKTKTQRQQKEQQSRELRRIFHSGASAHIVFVESDVLDKVLSMPMKDRKWFAPNKQQPLGFNSMYLKYIRVRWKLI